MSMEETDLLKSAVVEFSEKNISNNATAFERGGIPAEVVKAVAAQGFLGAAIPADSGGSGIDRSGYSVILRQLAVYSPSVSALVLITSSIASAALAKAAPDLLPDIASGNRLVGVDLSTAMDTKIERGALKISGSRIRGTVRYVLNGSGDLLIAMTSDGKLVVVDGGIQATPEEHHLSFRGLAYTKVKVDSGNFRILDEHGKDALLKIADSIDLEVASLALGIARGALNKVVEYTKVRKTFERPLKDYGPVADNISRLMSELRMAELNLESSEAMRDEEILMLKILSVDIAKRATKYALQYHGGYGYIEDFGVEKYYRDAAGLSILFQSPYRDAMRVAKAVYGEKSGYL